MANLTSLSPRMSSLLSVIQDTYVIFMLNVCPPCEKAKHVLMTDVPTKTSVATTHFAGKLHRK